MVNAVVGALRVNLGMNSAAFDKGADAATKRLNRMRQDIGQMGASFQRLGTRMSVGLTLPLVGLAVKSIEAAKVQEKAIAQVDAALASMGQTAGFTSEQLQKIASDLQNKSLFGDEEILTKVTSNLLTFGNISGDVFARAQQSALDLSAMLGQDLQSSAIQLGKALNDPATGLTALSRVGVSFTEEQKALVEAMVEVGNVAGAQNLILTELERQYAGQAEALANLDSGRITKVYNRIGDALEGIGAVILPFVASAAEGLATVVESFGKLDATTQKFAIGAAAVFAVGGPLLIGLGLTISSFALLAPAVALVAGPFAIIAAVGGVAAAAFLLLGDNAETASIPIYNASDAMATLNGDVQTFYTSRAPSAGKAAIALANDYVKLAQEAYNAADAMVAEKRARLESGRALLRSNPLTAEGSGTEADAAAALDASLADLARTERDLAEARAGQRRAVEAVTGATFDYTETTVGAVTETKVLIEGLDDLDTGLDNVGKGLGGVGSGGGKAAGGLKEVEAAAEDAADEIARIDDLFDRIADGFRTDGIKGAFREIASAASDEFGKILDGALSKGGGGFGAILDGLGGSLKDVGSGLASIFSGGGLTALTGTISAALPIIGAVSAVASLIKGFSSKKIIGQGIDLGVEGGDLVGGMFEQVKKSSFWGLISSKKTTVTPFADDMAQAFGAQLEAVQEGVIAAFSGFGVQVSDAMIKGVDLAIERIDTRGLSEEEVAAKINELFGSYADALADAVGGISFSAAATLAAATSILKPAGQSFFGAIGFMAGAAEDLATRIGGIESLGSKVGFFAESFFTEAEKLRVLDDFVTDALEPLGLTVPKTAKAFKELVLSQNLMTEAGREAYAALLTIAPQFRELTDAASDFGAFDFSQKRFDTVFDERIAQVAEARNYGLEEVRRLGGASLADGESLGRMAALLGLIEDHLDNIYQAGIPERRI